MTDHACPGPGICRLCANRDGAPDPTTLRRQGAAGRDRGADRAASRDPEWRDRALTGLLALAERMTEVTANDLRDLMGDDQPPHNNAWGAIFLDGARKGWIENTGRVTTTTKPDGHAARISVWRSLVCVGVPA